jgi:hypothetical protein
VDVFIGVLSLFFLLVVTFGVIAAVRVVRAVERGVERTGSQIRRTVEETALRARSAQPGPVGELARRRLELRSSIDGTRRALEEGATRDPSLREAIGLLDRLHEHARHLDGELRLLMEREPEKARAQARLPEMRERVARIKESADSLRFAAQDRARGYDAEGLSSLEDQIQLETGALRHWEREESRPGRQDHPWQDLSGEEHAGLGHAGQGGRSGGAADHLGLRPDPSELPADSPGPRGDRGGVPFDRSGPPYLGKGRPRNAS